jgi:NADPH-dependent 2,4-dienoyl-CoA reductase/sulfur reductase-like enzyme
VHYDKLVVATGARAERSSQPQTFGLQTMDDARRLDQFIREHNPRTAAVAGAGYIGLEVAGALRTRGLRVSVYQGSSDVLGREDRELTQAIQRHLARFDIELFLDSHSGPRSADLVVMATGMRPNVGLAADAGIEIGRTGAIRVTDRMETNINGIWAAGDCAEAHHIVTGRPAYVPLGTTANKMGRVAGANVAGARERFPGIVGTSIVSICGLAVGLTGLSEAQAAREGFSPVSARIESGDKPRYFRPQETTVELVADRSSRRILGGSVIGGRGVEGRVNTIAAALHGRLKMDEFEHLDMAYAPPFAPVWDPLLIAAQQLLKKL